MVHKQVDSGLGYTCDEQIVGILQAFNRIPGLRSRCSCQECVSGGILIEFNADSPRVEAFRDGLTESGLGFILNHAPECGWAQLIFTPGTEPNRVEEVLKGLR